MFDPNNVSNNHHIAILTQISSNDLNNTYLTKIHLMFLKIVKYVYRGQFDEYG